MADCSPVELLAEDFLDLQATQRGGPPFKDYLDRHPELAEEIRDLFPAAPMMEDLGEELRRHHQLRLSRRWESPVGGRGLQRLGDYRILYREIGRGGMGTSSTRPSRSRWAAASPRVLSAGSLLNPKLVRRFEREAKAAARLHHTNIVPVFGVGRQDDQYYYVMQFMSRA